MSLQAQACMLVSQRDVGALRAGVVEPPIGPRRILGAFAERVAKLVEDQLRDGVVYIEVLASRDQEATRAVTGGVRIARAFDAKPDFLGRRDPDALDVWARQRA
jgi:hypothetical protein